ncbi:uncharacterized protein PAC_20050 [Phialocephala subalpina]|uniref:Uncharacterized protein n=1 Tax=Phialocephala subalpina TaxID=576137 RepID=A0A1L7XYQ6_9HELO|nr:uncharacterized protein PAC_20050 [Phialocephala subalpina]
MANVTSTHLPAKISASQYLSLGAPYVFTAVLGYTILCSLLRYRRRDAMRRNFNFADRKSFSRMTNVDAQEIVTYLAELEFPKIMEMSLQFALFKTYGIPTISRLLVATKEFSSPESASKRYADTGVLIQEFTGHHPRSERAIKAIARMNYIHGMYQKSGKISIEDLLYTLSVFITEPITWVKKYEWREMTEMEICAIATFWKSIGDAMGIEYRGRLGRSEWADGLEFYDDIKNWAEAYEAQYIVHYSICTPTVHQTHSRDMHIYSRNMQKNLADSEVLTKGSPPRPTRPQLMNWSLYSCSFKSNASHVVGVLMGTRLRAAMSFPTPPRFYFNLTYILLETRRFCLRYFSLPRPEFLRVRGTSDNPDPTTGRFYLNNYLAHPFYIKPGFLNRWGPEAWFVWYMGGDVPGSKGSQYSPEGYSFQEVGPKIMKNRGLEETRMWEEKLKAERPTGCPFAFAK